MDAIFPGHGTEPGKPVINWDKIPYSLGDEAYLTRDDPLYNIMSKADGPFYFANDGLTHFGWQAGRYCPPVIRSRERQALPLGKV